MSATTLGGIQTSRSSKRTKMIVIYGTSTQKRVFIFSTFCLWSADHRRCWPRSVIGDSVGAPAGFFTTFYLAFINERREGANFFRFLSKYGRLGSAELAPRALGEGGGVSLQSLPEDLIQCYQTVRPNYILKSLCFLSDLGARTWSRKAFCTKRLLPDQFGRST